MRKGLPAKSAATDADDTRYDMAAGYVSNADGTPRAGVTGPIGANLVTATATMNVSVARFQGVAVRDGGVVELANDGPTNVLLEAAPPANSRIDVVWAKQNDASATVTVPDANNLPVFGVTKGDAAPVPVKKAIPAGALELATVQVPSTAIATNSANVVITQSAPLTAAAGGVVPFRTKAELDLWLTAAVNQRASVIGTGVDYRWDGATWASTGETDWITWGTAPTALTVGTGGAAGLVQRYKRINGRFFFHCKYTFGTSGAVMGTNPTINLPFAIAMLPAGNYPPVGSGQIYDASAGNVPNFASGLIQSATTMRLTSVAAGVFGTITPTAPIVWAAGDIIEFGFWADLP